MVTQHLLAILPPDNVAGEIADIQMTLFRLHAAASSQALPPFLPVVWTGPEIPESVAARELLTGIEPIGVGPPRIVGQAVVIPVELGLGWERWIDSVARWRCDNPDPLTARLPPPASGFFVSEVEGAPFEIPDVRLSAKRLSSIAICRIAVSFADPRTPWESVDWQVEWKVFAKLRG